MKYVSRLLCIGILSTSMVSSFSSAGHWPDPAKLDLKILKHTLNSIMSQMKEDSLTHWFHSQPTLEKCLAATDFSKGEIHPVIVEDGTKYVQNLLERDPSLSAKKWALDVYKWLIPRSPFFYKIACYQYFGQGGNAHRKASWSLNYSPNAQNDPGYSSSDYAKFKTELEQQGLLSYVEQASF